MFGHTVIRGMSVGQEERPITTVKGVRARDSQAARVVQTSLLRVPRLAEVHSCFLAITLVDSRSLSTSLSLSLSFSHTHPAIVTTPLAQQVSRLSRHSTH